MSDEAGSLDPPPEPLPRLAGDDTESASVSSPAERSSGKGTQAFVSGYRLDPRIRGDGWRSSPAQSKAARSAREGGVPERREEPHGSDGTAGLPPSPSWGGRTAAEGGAPGGENPCGAEQSPRRCGEALPAPGFTPPVSPFACGSGRSTLPIEGREEEGSATEPHLRIAGIAFLALPEGALFQTDERLLVVADLHLEKGSSYAARRVHLPPYDTAATLARLAGLVQRLAPRSVVALGDTFHDRWAHKRIAPADRATFLALLRGKSFVAVAGNHDPAPFPGLVELPVPEFRLGPLVFRHEPSVGPAPGEIAGHLHPAARVIGRGGSVRRRCFAGDGSRAVLPAFGAFAGGLNVREPALAGLFDSTRFAAHVLGQTRVYAVASSRLRDG